MKLVERGAFVCSPLTLNLQMEIIECLEMRGKMLSRSSEQQSINGLVLNSQTTNSAHKSKLVCLMCGANVGGRISLPL